MGRVASDTAGKPLEVGKAPHGLAMAPDGKRLLVTVYGSGLALTSQLLAYT